MTASFLAQVPSFVDALLDKLKSKNINVGGLLMDHVCYRVETAQEYEERKAELLGLGKLLTEEVIGGRPIATVKLHEPIQCQNGPMYLIELPMPKPNVFYKSGFEHAEFVIKDNLQEFADRHSWIKWDFAGLNKDINADIRVELDESTCVKFHNSSLEHVIEYEQSLKK